MLEAFLAADIYLTLGGWSYHPAMDYRKCSGEYSTPSYKCKDKKYNESHKSIILDVNGFTVGTFENSFNRRTNLIGYTYRFENNISLGAYYGTGYTGHEYNKDRCKTKFVNECVLLSIGYSIRPIKLSIMGKALAVSFEFKI